MKTIRGIAALLFGINILFINSSFAQDSIQANSAEEDSFVVIPSEIPTVYNSKEIPTVPDMLIEDRLKCLEKTMPLTYNKTIRGFIDYFTVRNRKYIATMERRKNLYFPIFEEYLKKYDLPDELKYLSIVESGLNPRAISPAGAGGLWQFMPATGRMYRLKQDAYLDERFDPYTGTDAACKFLKELYAMFSDWELALAAYNCGPGNVRSAIRRSGYKETFWEIYRYLPAETRGYVPQFVAVVYAMNHLKDHNIVVDSLEYPMQFDTVHVTTNMNLHKLCEQLNICIEDIQKLNQGLKKNIIPATLNYALRIPSDKYPLYIENRLAIHDSCSKDCDKEITLINTQVAQDNSKKKIIYTVKNGDVLGKIAGKHGVTVAQLKSWNKIKGNTIRVGQKLVIYKKGAYVPPSNNSTNLAKNKTTIKSTAPLTGKVYYVQPGDTLWSISKKSNITIEQLKKKNNLKDNELKVGMKLII